MEINPGSESGTAAGYLRNIRGQGTMYYYLFHQPQRRRLWDEWAPTQYPQERRDTALGGGDSLSMGAFDWPVDLLEKRASPRMRGSA